MSKATVKTLLQLFAPTTTGARLLRFNRLEADLIQSIALIKKAQIPLRQTNCFIGQMFLNLAITRHFHAANLQQNGCVGTSGEGYRWGLPRGQEGIPNSTQQWIV